MPPPAPIRGKKKGEGRGQGDAVFLGSVARSLHPTPTPCSSPPRSRAACRRHGPVRWHPAVGEYTGDPRVRPRGWRKARTRRPARRAADARGPRRPLPARPWPPDWPAECTPARRATAAGVDGQAEALGNGATQFIHPRRAGRDRLSTLSLLVATRRGRPARRGCGARRAVTASARLAAVAGTTGRRRRRQRTRRASAARGACHALLRLSTAGTQATSQRPTSHGSSGQPQPKPSASPRRPAPPCLFFRAARSCCTKREPGGVNGCCA